MSHMDFSSWSREQESSFVVYEQKREESQKTAWIAAAVAGAFVLVATIGIYAGVAPDSRHVSKDIDNSNLTKKGDQAPAPDKK